jgi:oligogalacturonide lyase
VSPGGTPKPAYKETYDEWVTHEAWWGKDEAVFTVWPYDEKHLELPHGIFSVNVRDGKFTQHAQYKAWHTHGSVDKQWIVGDDFDRNLWLIRVADGERRLLTQGHKGEGFATHPHMSFTPDGASVVFSSSRNGSDSVFLVDVPEFESLPKE